MGSQWFSYPFLSLKKVPAASVRRTVAFIGSGPLVGSAVTILAFFTAAPAEEDAERFMATPRRPKRGKDSRVESRKRR